MICPYCHTDHSNPKTDAHCNNDMLKRSTLAGSYHYHFYDPNHPLAKVSKSLKGMVDLSRHLTSIRRGQWLEPQEIVHFVNGDVRDFSPENLAVGSKLRASTSVIRICVVCGKEYKVVRSHIERRHTCSEVCRLKRSERFSVDPDELLVSVWTESVLELSHSLMVSDKAIEKRCKKFGIAKPPRGYWAMLKQGMYTHENALLALGWSRGQIADLDHKLGGAKARLQPAKLKKV